MKKIIPILLSISSIVLISACSSTGTNNLIKNSGKSSFACKNYSSQAAAQKAWVEQGSPAKNDPNNDNIVCTSLPSSKASAPSTGGQTAKNTDKKDCLLQKSPRTVLISRAKYPETSLHIEKAIDMGQPSLMTIDRGETDRKRAEWRAVVADQDNLSGRGLDQDEWPMAFTKEGGRAANIALINSSDNRGAGSSIAGQLRSYCNGQKFKVSFYSKAQKTIRILIIANNGKRTNIEVGN
jgi:hypothetical protein